MKIKLYSMKVLKEKYGNEWGCIVRSCCIVEKMYGYLGSVVEVKEVEDYDWGKEYFQHPENGVMWRWPTYTVEKVYLEELSPEEELVDAILNGVRV